MTTPSGIKKANFFIIGAPKCGTTAWFNYLKSHPDIFLTDYKEPTYFSLDLPKIRWISTPDEYRGLFSPADGQKVIGEASTSYMYSTEAAKAIHEYNPDAKILAFLREQENFLPSLHHEYLYSFREDISDFEKAWRSSASRTASNVPRACSEPKLLNYAARGRFHEQLSRYLDCFPARQVLVIKFGDWTADPRAAYLRILQFLELDDDGRTDFPRINEAKSHRIEWLGRLVQNPPTIAMKTVKWLQKLLGKPTFGLSRRAARLIAVKGYTTSVRPELRDEIRRYYKDDNRQLDDRLQAIAKGSNG